MNLSENTETMDIMLNQPIGSPSIIPFCLRRRLPILLLPALLALGGCASFNLWATEVRLAPQLQRANDHFDRGEYFEAAALYENLADRYPLGTEKRAQILMRQGIAFYKKAAYHEARDQFLDLLEQYPAGQSAEDARYYLATIDYYMSSDSPARLDAVAAAEQDLDELQTLLKAHPHDPSILEAIGNLFFELERYDEALEYYRQAGQFSAANTEKLLAQRRMYVAEDGQFRLITPAVARELDKEDNPLVVFGRNDYHERANSDFNQASKRYHVTGGKVRNQSKRILRNVVVEVSFLNTNFDVLDVELVQLGTMAPGMVKPFIASADNYDNLYNIDHVEFQTYWDE